MDICESLNLKKWINAWDTISSFGGSLMPREVLDLLCSADADETADADMLELIGAELASLCRVEAACITPGTSAGIFCSIFAAIQAGTSYDIVMMCSHRNHYDTAIRLAGGKIQQVGISWSTEEWELDGALSKHPAALLFIAAEKHSKFGLPLEKCAELAHRYDVPVIVDAAAQVPPSENLRTYLAKGADLVLFSGGKAIRGPQSVGLAVGTSAQIARLNALRRDPRFAELLPIGKAEARALLKAVGLFVNAELEQQQYELSRKIAYVFANRLSESGLYRVQVFERSRLGQKICCCEATFLNNQKLPYLTEFLQNSGILIGKAPEDPGTLIINPLLLKPEQIDKVVEVMTEV